MQSNASFPPALKLVVGLVSAVIAIALLLSLAPFTIVSPTERAIVLRVGKIDRVLSEGIHWKTPFIEEIETIDISVHKEEVAATAASKDLQDVSASVAVNFSPDPEKVTEIWRSYKNEYTSRVVAPAIQESIKAATAKYTAEELVTKREAVKSDIQGVLEERLKGMNIILHGVSITNFSFSGQFNTAIEAKVRAEQEALTAKNQLEKVKYEAEQKIAQARAEAESIRMQSQAADNEKYVQLKEIEVRMEMAKKWNGQLPTNLYGSAPIPLLDITK